MLVKTVRVSNPRNVLVQIPSFVVANWNLNADTKLEVHYDEDDSKITIKPSIYRRSCVDEES